MSARYEIIFFLFLALLNISSASKAASLPPPLTIKIELSRDKFAIGEPIEGKVIIDSSLPATYPAGFQTKVYKNGELVNDSTTQTPIFQGRVEYRLKAFVPFDISKDPKEAGTWRIVISQAGYPEEKAEAEFLVGD